MCQYANEEFIQIHWHIGISAHYNDYQMLYLYQVHEVGKYE